MNLERRSNVRKRGVRFLCALLGCLAGPALPYAADSCVSGPQSGQRPGPYSFVVCTGPQRGQSYCYVCETADHPAVIVFARAPSDALGKLAARIDKAVEANRTKELRGWVTFLHADQATLDAQVVAWGTEHAIRGLPLGVFEDADGPPSYRLARDAEVTVLLFVKKKVTANFAFRAGELTDEAAAEVVKAIPDLLDGK